MFRLSPLLLLFVFLLSCSTKTEKTTQSKSTGETGSTVDPKYSFYKNFVQSGKRVTLPDSFPLHAIKEGKVLADKYCQHCHMKPEPEWLNKRTWFNSVLPNMSVRLGRFSLGDTTLDYIPEEWFEKGAGGARVKALAVFPQKPIVSHEDWKKIVAYYVASAPDEVIPQQPHEKLNVGLKRFNVQLVEATDRLRPDLSLVRINEATKEIYVGEATDNTLKILDQNFKIKSTVQFNSPPVDIKFFSQFYFVTTIGSLPATDNHRGEVVMVLPKPNNLYELKLIIKGLPRSVDLNFGDFNVDGNMDFVTSGFGNWTGGLTWHEKLDGPNLLPHDINKEPGTVKTYTRDFNNDNLPDIIALSANGDEGITVYLNQGNKLFTSQRIVRLPPCYGSNYFELVDFDKDGLEDIMMTNGDNADYTPFHKSYHGIRIFKNYGNMEFKQIYFYPMHGVVKARAHDFDQDGDLDIAAIASFPNFEEGIVEGFTFLENIGSNRFNASTFPDAKIARWLVMDIGDVDADGDTDIILGAHNMPSDVPAAVLNEWNRKPTPMVVLTNNLISKAAQ